MGLLGCGVSKWAATWQNQQSGCAPSKDSDQSRLVRVFAVRLKKAWVLSYPFSTSEDSDQTGRMPRQIWVFAERIAILLVLSWGGSNADHPFSCLCFKNYRYVFFDWCLYFNWPLVRCCLVVSYNSVSTLGVCLGVWKLNTSQLARNLYFLQCFTFYSTLDFSNRAIGIINFERLSPNFIADTMNWFLSSMLD